MPNEVNLSVKADIAKALESLGKVNDYLESIGTDFKSVGKEVDKEFNSNVKETETFLDKLSNMSRRVADRIRDDFKSLVSLESLSSGLKLSSQFKGSIEESVQLSNTIRKLGGIFGIAESDFMGFQSSMTKGLGEIGLSSEVAARALEGLSETPIRGQKNLEEYSKTAGQLASIGGEKGKEGEIAKGIVKVVQARGGNPQDLGQMRQVANSVLAVQQTTGAHPSQVLANMEKIFSGMSSDFRKTMQPQSVAKLAGAAAVAGPNATTFIESFLRLGKTQRAGLEARGVGNLFGPQGFNPEQIKKFAAEAQKLGGGDMRLGLKAMGIESDEAAEGFLRLRDNLEQVVDAQRKIGDSTKDLTQTYMKSRTLQESFQGALNKVKGMAGGATAAGTQGLTEFVQGASQSNTGAIGTVIGGGILASVLAGGGLKGIAGVLTGEAKSKATEALTGEKVVNVKVVNAEEISGKMGGVLEKATGLLGKGAGAAGGLLKGAAGVGGAFAVGTAIGEGLNTLIETHTVGKTKEGFEGNIIEQLFFKLDKLVGGETSRQFQQSQKVLVELKSKELKEAKPGSRGGSS